jgi:arabinosaccharide transport system permease protein
MEEKVVKENKFLKFLNSKKVVPYIFVLPFIISFTILTLYPAIQAIIMSFQRILPGQVEFVGINNYRRLLNPVFYRAFLNTVMYTVLTIIILVPIPMIIAVFLNSKLVRFKTIFKSSLFIPSLTSVVVAGLIFRLIFAESSLSIANQVIGFFGIDPIVWTTQRWSAMFLMVILATWRWMGVNILYFLAGLQNIPEEMYESADIDGANIFQKFRHITVPFLKPVTVFVTTISIIGGFRVFEESYVFWEASSPGNIATTLVSYLYQQGIQRNDMGFGAAIGVIVLIIIFVVSLVYLVLTDAFNKRD